MTNGTAKKGGGGGGGRDMVLESRHLLGLFLGVVVICGVFFTLGFVMGRTQYDSSVRAASATVPQPKTEPARAPVAATPGAPKPSDWDFYRATESKKTESAVKPTETAKAEPPKPAETSKPAASNANFKPPLIPRGAILLQVAALTSENDALALAGALQQKKHPAFVQVPSTDSYYRVQVGPYADAKSAEIEKKALESDGFKAIVKR